MGHPKRKQTSFFNPHHWKHQLSHGGELRKKKAGRGSRPLSSKEPVHVVFKVEYQRLRHRSLRTPQSYKLVLKILQKYSQHFAVKTEQLSIQNDHVHLLIRTSKRKQFHSFFRVVAGQIAQSFAKEGLLTVSGTESKAKGSMVTDGVRSKLKSTGQSLKRSTKSIWKCRPFTRVVRGWKAYQIVRNYIQLNEKEARGEIRYRKSRLRGLSSSDWNILWT